jgi:hypothetical protein
MWVPFDAWWVVQAPARRTARTDVEVQGVAGAVVTDEGVRDVHPLLGLDVDQAVATEVDELATLRLLAELREEALGRLLQPDPAVLRPG